MTESDAEKERQPTSPPPEGPTPARHFPVVGVAASAGGLEAFRALLSAMPASTGMAFVLVPHLDPSHASLMVDLLRPHTCLTVEEARDGVAVQPDGVYVIPPNRNLEIHDGILHLSQPAHPHPATPPIDRFLRSLAEDQREMAIGIVLSGTGSHGTAGLQAIKARGGLTLAQDPGEAGYDQMPSSAITADAADHVLPVADMPKVLSAYAQHPYANGATKEALNAGTGDYLGRILALLKARTKYNFNDYRKKMLGRRIQRRMSLNQIEDPGRYIEVLREDADELKELFQDLLIDVSGFFRDPEAFNILAQRIIPDLIENKAGDDAAIRVWIPGCATGEEAYSIAILFYEVMDRLKKHAPFQIFATDINEQALTMARHGTYPEGIATDVSTERLQRFFTRDGAQYQVTKAVRESVMFAAQNLISDPPFSKLDLISCRNLLIYLEPEAQQRVLGLFHFALNEGGYLFLGSSETVGRHVDLFQPVSKKWRIFRRVGPARSERLEYPVSPYLPAQVLPPGKGPFAAREALSQAVKVGALAERLLLDTYAPACVLINRKLDVVYLHGATQRYLNLPPGEPTHNLLAMTDAALSARIRALCYQIDRGEQQEMSGDTRILRNDASQAVRVTVTAVHRPRGLEGLMLVSFEDVAGTEQTVDATKAADAGDKSDLVEQLEYELKSTREDLQSTIEELESSNEELKSSNEEMMSMNEEFQSVNEELESSKEELQSVNEELNTVNNQLEEKVAELDKVNSDLSNLLNSTDIATLFLDTDLQVRRFTPSTVKLLNLMPTDVGRSISDFSYKFNDDALLTDARKVLDRLAPIDKHVWTDDGICYLRRILPYRTLDNRIEGVVVTFVDVTSQVAADRELQRMAALLKDANVAIIIKDPDGRITGWNKGAERLYGYSEAEALKMNILDMTPPDLHGKTRAMFERITRGEDVGSFETQRITKRGETLDVALNATRLTDERGRVVGLVGAEHNMTDRKRLEHELTTLNEDLRARVAAQNAEARQKARELQDREQYLSAVINTTPDGLIMVDRGGVITGFNPAAQRMFGYGADEAAGHPATVLFLSPPNAGDPEWLAGVTLPHEEASATALREYQGQRKDGSTFPMQLTAAAIDHLGLYLLVARDISAQRNLEREVVEVSSQEQERIGREIHDGLGQRLSALLMMASSLEKQLPDVTARQRDLLKEFVKQLRAIADEAHTLSQGLVPVPLDPAGLKTSLEQLVQGVSSFSGIPCQLKAGRGVKIHDRVQALQLYRIAQEAVNNAVKHAHAKRITVELTAASGVSLKVRDDGKGFDLKRSTARLGLHTMRYRANLIGADLDITSEPGKGTVVTCTLAAPLVAGRRK